MTIDITITPANSCDVALNSTNASVIYWAIIAAISIGMIICGFIPLKEERSTTREAPEREKQIPEPITKSKNETEKLLEQLQDLEWKWNKAIIGYTPLLLTACVAYFGYLAFGLSQEALHEPTGMLGKMISVKAEVGWVTITCIINMFFTVTLYLSAYFIKSYPAQERIWFHTGLYRIAMRASLFWHLPIFASLILQAVLVGHIFVALAFQI